MREAHGITRRSARTALIACGLAAALGAIAPVPVFAQTSAKVDLQMEGPRTLVIHYRADADKRAAFRQFMTGPHAALLRKLKQERKIEGFRTFFSWYAQPTVWDAMVELRFSDFAAMGVVVAATGE